MSHFSFPFQPYSIQMEFMEKLYNTIDNKHVGIYESPTGTGKSLSIICASLSWMRKNTENGFSIESAENVAPKVNKSCEPDWLHNFSSDGQHGTQTKLKKRIQSSYERIDKIRTKKIKLSRVKVLDKKNDFDDHKEDFVLLDEYHSDVEDASSTVLKYETDLNTYRMEQAVEGQVKILFCSRTHSQLSQFVKEIKKTEFGKSVHCITLGSRKMLCNHKAVKSMKSDVTRTEKCLELQKQKGDKKGCEYYGSEKVADYKENALASIRDVEELVELGDTLKTCSYYGTRSAIELAQIIAMPYSMLLNQSTRRASGISLKDSIVICDEAHNIIEAVNQVYSHELQLSEINSGHEALSAYLKKYQARLLGGNKFYIRQLLRILRTLKASITKYISSNSTTSTIWAINDFLFQNNLDNFNLFKIKTYLAKSKLAQKLQGFINLHADDQALKTKTSNKMSPFYAIESFLDALTNTCDDGRVVIHAACGTKSAYFKFMQLNPAVHFKQIVDEARSVILAGGTMSPTSDVINQLFSHVPKSRIDIFSCNHIVPVSSILPMSISRGPSGKPFNFTFDQRSQFDVIDELGRFMSNICKVVPDGVVCFFPSYTYCDVVLRRWQATKKFDKIQKAKRIFHEPSDQPGLENILDKYTQEIKKGSGGLLCSVVGGKMSEGINFSDELARCVVVVGLPYPNAGDAELKEKMKYLDKAMAPIAGISAGRQYYENACMKAVNQSIGRAIRHQADYAAILLIDQRYEQEKIIKRIPTWINQSLTIPATFGVVQSKLAKFFRSKPIS